VQYSTHFVGRQVNIGLAVVSLNKAVAIAVAEYGALEFSEESGSGAGNGMICFDKKSLS
jgi:hypothetical protein